VIRVDPASQVLCFPDARPEVMKKERKVRVQAPSVQLGLPFELARKRASEVRAWVMAWFEK
jgi:hypothetical protein